MPENVRADRLRVGRNVRRLRQSRGFSQERLAELVGNSGKHIGQVERGEVNVGLDILSGIARALSADVSELFVAARRRARAEPPLFLIAGRELDQIDAIVRKVRPPRVNRTPRARE
jgi:transcriptional regulator with XRE-family HTH domain